MQTPVKPVTAINAINGPTSFRHDFSPAQLDLIKVYLTQLTSFEDKVTSAKQSIGLFMDYLRKENTMSASVVWSLSVDPDGKPFMSGAPAK